MRPTRRQGAPEGGVETFDGGGVDHRPASRGSQSGVDGRSGPDDAVLSARDTALGVALDDLSEQEARGHLRAWPTATSGPHGHPKDTLDDDHVAGQSIDADQDTPGGEHRREPSTLGRRSALHRGGG